MGTMYTKLWNKPLVAIVRANSKDEVTRQKAKYAEAYHYTNSGSLLSFLDISHLQTTHQVVMAVKGEAGQTHANVVVESLTTFSESIEDAKQIASTLITEGLSVFRLTASRVKPLQEITAADLSK